MCWIFAALLHGDGVAMVCNHGYGVSMASGYLALRKKKKKRRRDSGAPGSRFILFFFGLRSGWGLNQIPDQILKLDGLKQDDRPAAE